MQNFDPLEETSDAIDSDPLSKLPSTGQANPQDLDLVNKYFGVAGAVTDTTAGYPFLTLAGFLAVCLVLLNPWTCRAVLEKIGEWSFFLVQVTVLMCVVGFVLWKN